MNILLVDDEPYILEDIRHSLDFAALGIERVYTAPSAERAWEQLEGNGIALIITDIDMPGGSGIELISRVRENYPDIERIFITCHADFSFAKQAIRLGSLDYLLKPLDYGELASCIVAAQKRILERTEVHEVGRYKSYWFKYQRQIIEQFWMDIIGCRIKRDREAIRAEAEERHIPFQDGLGYLLVLLGLHFPDKRPSLEEEAALIYELRQKGEAELARDRQDGMFLELRRRQLLGVFPFQRQEETKAILDRLPNFLSGSHRQFQCDFSCFWVSCGGIEALADQTAALQKQQDGNIAYFNCVFGPEDRRSGRTTAAPDFRSWRLFIKNGQGQRVLNDLNRILAGMRRDRVLNAAYLQSLQQDYLQVIYAVLDERGVPAHELLYRTEETRPGGETVASVKDFLDWAAAVMQKTAACLADTADNKIARAEKFIAAGLDRELSREEVAAHVYLHPDYFDRLFKKQTGISVHQYILRERVKTAATLLKDTEATVSDIAGQLGYANVSNFSAMFKKITGVNPSEYRTAAIAAGITTSSPARPEGTYRGCHHNIK